ncbi:MULTISPECIES: hypothetical protein [Methanosarcina]|uniref:hypothetical protein n=1 Tax=Methanosarcina TaxID=2207 RepID=UPI0012E07901|nr:MULTISPECIES: hypothetical protein [Methanosarcina]
MVKGETLDAAGRLEEAIETFENALELSVYLFLEAQKTFCDAGLLNIQKQLQSRARQV